MARSHLPSARAVAVPAPVNVAPAVAVAVAAAAPAAANPTSPPQVHRVPPPQPNPLDAMAEPDGQEAAGVPPEGDVVKVRGIVSHASDISESLAAVEESMKEEAEVTPPPNNRHDAMATMERKYMRERSSIVGAQVGGLRDLLLGTLRDTGAFAAQLAVGVKKSADLYREARNLSRTIRHAVHESAKAPSPADINEHRPPQEICVGAPDRIFQMTDATLVANLPLLCSLLADLSWTMIIDQTPSRQPFFDLNPRYIKYSAEKYPDPASKEAGSPYEPKRRRLLGPEEEGDAPEVSEVLPPDNYPEAFLDKMHPRFSLVSQDAVIPSDLQARAGVLVSEDLMKAALACLPKENEGETVPTLLFDSQVHEGTTLGRKVWGKTNVVVFVQAPKQVNYVMYFSIVPLSEKRPDDSIEPEYQTHQKFRPTHVEDSDAFIIEERGTKMHKFTADNPRNAVVKPAYTVEDTIMFGFGKNALRIHLNKKSGKLFLLQQLCKSVATTAAWEAEFNRGEVFNSNLFNSETIDPDGRTSPCTFSRDHHNRTQGVVLPLRIVAYQLHIMPDDHDAVVFPHQLSIYNLLDKAEGLHTDITQAYHVEHEPESDARHATANLCPSVAPPRTASAARKKSDGSKNALFDKMVSLKCQEIVSAHQLLHLSKNEIRLSRLALYLATTQLPGGRLVYVQLGERTFLTTKATLLTIPQGLLARAIRTHEAENSSLPYPEDAEETPTTSTFVHGALDDATPDALLERLRESQAYYDISKTGHERIAQLKDQLLSTDSIDNPQSQALFDTFRDANEGYYGAILTDFAEVQKFLTMMKKESRHLLVDLREHKLEPLAFEIVLDHLRLVRLYRCGFDDPGPLELPEDRSTRRAVEHVLSQLEIDCHSY